MDGNYIKVTLFGLCPEILEHYKSEDGFTNFTLDSFNNFVTIVAYKVQFSPSSRAVEYTDCISAGE